MDFGQIVSFVQNNQLLAAAGALLAYWFKKMVTWVMEHREQIQALALRVEKDAEDGWTQQEKENLAVELFFKEIYPGLPWYARLLPKAWIENKVRELVRAICARSHVLKDKIQEMRPA